MVSRVRADLGTGLIARIKACIIMLKTIIALGVLAMPTVLSATGGVPGSLSMFSRDGWWARANSQSSLLSVSLQHGPDTSLVHSRRTIPKSTVWTVSDTF
jgi:hypothetical protein